MTEDVWADLVKEYSPLYNSVFVNARTGEHFVFFGLVDAEDDFYYGMRSCHNYELLLLTCVGSLEQQNFHLVWRANNEH